MSVLVEATDLRRVFDDGRVEALRGVRFAIDDGEFVAIQGPSGSGKSTLLQMLGALDVPTSGHLRWNLAPRNGAPVTSIAMEQIADLAAFRAKTIGFIFQAFHLLPTLSALENVQLPMFETAWPAAERRRRAADLLGSVGLSERLGHLPAKLSGGERQRVAIARSLANEPRLLLADEPTGNLDSDNAARIMALLETIHLERKMTLIVVTHDASIAAHAHRTLHMLDGRIVRESTAAMAQSAG